MDELKKVPTFKLAEELKGREGVAAQMINVNEPFAITINGEQKDLTSAFGLEVEKGPLSSLWLLTNEFYVHHIAY